MLFIYVLFAVSNKISKIENLDKLTNLEMLELGDNKIRKIENLDKLANLNEIYLGRFLDIFFYKNFFFYK